MVSKMIRFSLNTFRRYLVSTLAVGLSACGGVPLVDWEHGARHGRIVEIISSQASVAGKAPCIEALPPKTFTEKRYARVAIHGVRSLRFDFAEIPPEIQTTRGTAVEIFPANCDKGELGRITRVLPSE